MTSFDFLEPAMIIILKVSYFDSNFSDVCPRGSIVNKSELILVMLSKTKTKSCVHIVMETYPHVAVLLWNLNQVISVCPEQEAILLTHNDPESQGTSSLTLYFRYPPGKPLYYQWLLRSKNDVIFYYLVSIIIANHASGSIFNGGSIYYRIDDYI